jgi:hypothetical protein
MLMVVFLSGCIQENIVIHVKPDGSGTIEETSLLSNIMLELMESMGDSMADSGKQKSDQDNKDATQGDSKKSGKKTRDDAVAKMVKDAETRAATFGSTVKFISAKPVTTDTGSGYFAVYAFQDISLVKVNQNPSGKMDVPKTEKSDASQKEEFLLFSFMKGSPAKLVVTFPARKDATDDKPGAPDTTKVTEEKPNKEADKQSLEMMKTLFKDMKLSISLQFEGTIVNTNATYRDGSTVGLIEMDFAKMMDDAERLNKLGAATPQTIEETKALFKGFKGVKYEMNNPVIVEFK